MSKRIKLLLLVIVGTSQCLGIDTVKDFDVSKYYGRWYQVYASRSVTTTFEKDRVCILGDYTPRKEGGIHVKNAARFKTVTGPVRNITGYAFIQNPNQPGKLKVLLRGMPHPQDYWIVMVGPQEGNNPYEFSVVSNRLKSILFVLTRDLSKYGNKYDKQVQAFLKKNGFTKYWNEPTHTKQSKNCNYDVL